MRDAHYTWGVRSRRLAKEIYEFYINNEVFTPFNSPLSSICFFLSVFAMIKNICHSVMMVHTGFEKEPRLSVSGKAWLVTIVCDQGYKVKTE